MVLTIFTKNPVGEEGRRRNEGKLSLYTFRSGRCDLRVRARVFGLARVGTTACVLSNPSSRRHPLKSTWYHHGSPSSRRPKADRVLPRVKHQQPSQFKCMLWLISSPACRMCVCVRVCASKQKRFSPSPLSRTISFARSFPPAFSLQPSAFFAFSTPLNTPTLQTYNSHETKNHVHF